VLMVRSRFGLIVSRWMAFLWLNFGALDDLVASGWWLANCISSSREQIKMSDRVAHQGAISTKAAQWI
jgi:aspartokinase-like uncharacterized kinase